MFNLHARTQSSTAKKTDLSFLLILSALMAFTSLSTDIYPGYARHGKRFTVRCRADNHRVSYRLLHCVTDLGTD
ncbi:hypothetical protein SGGMMB4_03549 [Sodalis glossinidius str. 'morsitans']|uniref:Uncharacterized protein n=1 Tax=Sodalis glossinidius (strain morsitans) TaxID=343509 RepID=A0A193QKA6_SODGM|nr:hypothetical protein SGGMMB4_03549 [Sodalis glossinidius str. 'morsitans']